MSQPSGGRVGTFGFDDRTVDQVLRAVTAVLPDKVNAPSDEPIIPTNGIKNARQALQKSLPELGVGFERTLNHLSPDIVNGLNLSSLSPRYYGFVTGGNTPAALAADFLTSIYDQNVGVHLPEETIATNLEANTLDMLLDLLRLDPETFTHKIFTTGATASNVLGLALGREWLIRRRAELRHVQLVPSVATDGLLSACFAVGIERIDILSTLPHSSINKAASIVGLGRHSVRSIPVVDSSVRLDVAWFTHYLAGRPAAVATILVLSAGEVNTGHFATGGLEDLKKLRELCTAYNVWIHIDGAFGLFSRLLLPPKEQHLKLIESREELSYDPIGDFSRIASCSLGFELADSITGDGHKFLNVPYDCGFFFSRHKGLVQTVFGNGDAAYLAAPGVSPTVGMSQDHVQLSVVPSPLNIGIENSRRLRAFPVYASLVAYGRDGYTDMLKSHIKLARKIAQYLFHHKDYILLPLQQPTEHSSHGHSEEEEKKVEFECLASTYTIVLFRARDPATNQDLVSNIKKTGKIYVTGTKWDGLDATRIAVSNWRCDVERDFAIVKDVLDDLVKA